MEPWLAYMEMFFGIGDTAGRSHAFWVPCLASEISPGCNGVAGAS